ncbi:hypothetical protein PENSOL_c048G10483 [Penicillium solitum]|uniref:Apple domain-containing protein n=1 Tax=Penicillium solitum TaxID=60172 RepID=A0A1V6QSE8_9EURO|nr:uncharacterized protein PENSOL_c048G10483 [Penicillium solitum]OQD91846.1 hypothetical protein PENSOL_c048G10483 [Penicillium solitum]
MQLPLILKGLPLPILLTLGLSLVTSIKAQGSSPYGSGTIPDIPGGGGSSNPPHVPGGGGSSNTPHVPGGDGSSNSPYVPGGGGSSNSPYVPGGGGSSNTPHVPGGGVLLLTSNTPHVPGGDGSSNTPHVPGGGGSSNTPHVPGGGGSSNTPHVPGGGGSSNTPHVPGGLVRTCPLTSERLVEPMTYFTVVADPKCPNDNGHTFLTDDGAYYTLLCCTHNPSGTEIDGSRSVVPSFKDCATKCSSTSGCQSYVFSARSNRDDALGTCKLYNGGGFQTTECGDDTHDYAYITAPPTIHSPDTASTACATECPLSDGQQYKSKGGETARSDMELKSSTKRFMKTFRTAWMPALGLFPATAWITTRTVSTAISAITMVNLKFLHRASRAPTLSDAREHAMARQHAAVVDRSIT